MCFSVNQIDDLQSSNEKYSWTFRLPWAGGKRKKKKKKEKEGTRSAFSTVFSTSLKLNYAC